MAMREARDDLDVTKAENMTAEQEMDRENEIIGQALVDMPLKRRTADDTSERSIEEFTSSANKTKRLKRMESGGDMERFGTNLRNADFVCIELDRGKLVFDRERSEADLADRKRE